MLDINSFNEYKIKRETIEAIAEKLRVMVGKTAKLTTEEIIYWLGRVKFTPQGQAESYFIFDNNIHTSVLVLIPDVVKAIIISNVLINHNQLQAQAFGINPEVKQINFSNTTNLSINLFTTHASGI